MFFERFSGFPTVWGIFSLINIVGAHGSGWWTECSISLAPHFGPHGWGLGSMRHAGPLSPALILRRDESSPNFNIAPFGHGAPVQCWSSSSAAGGKSDFGFSDLEIKNCKCQKGDGIRNRVLLRPFPKKKTISDRIRTNPNRIRNRIWRRPSLQKRIRTESEIAFGLDLP